ncbi:LysR family transcriptional regulator ArgP [Microbacterium pseudoresistens]|uniref:LysR family transcriptional regulator (Chromosome initiation inhibitor) n=1 Tax=Microbacterium pseudoresistens TaxID=640634 RepID=A0A7Y9ET20_9MICO|nr:LysR family transcriptional regulator ArgP [Microbacterium pseudoresistens]NYD53443.1 LysR family transcriptional regulator (chromosome initiation inhibitor) [Microbacterium pseudoresistens]
MRIDPELAETVAVILDEGSMDAAARVLHITPSAVSQRVKQLEQQLGRVLVVRGRPATSTPAGEAVARMARQLRLLQHDAAARLGVAADEGARLRIPLAVNADSMATWFLPPLAELSRTHGVDAELHREDQSYTARLLESGVVMAAVTSQAEPVAGCVVRPLGVLVYEAVATQAFVEHWFPEGVTREALAHAPFIDFDRRDALQQDWLRGQGVDPLGVPRHYVPGSADFAEAVRLGMGWGMLPALQRVVDADGDDLVPLGGRPARVPLHWQRWDLRSELLDAVTAAVAAEAERVLER